MFNFNVSRNLFAVLEDEEGDVVAPKPVADSDAKKDWSHLPWEKQSKNVKKHQQKKEETQKKPPISKDKQSKPLNLPGHAIESRRVVRTRANSTKDMINGNGVEKQTRVHQAVSPMMTLEEYEERLKEKKTAQIQLRSPPSK
ncbi:PREDICTED: uncharacterized protein LOC104811488 [Tarenaya hassleriana]|uniref:uncharacterized protein LOC104811488 n=1 Tax=Tarenaya hassleriana TaxID=28532 RepID=UPI00053C37EF|nr:PREDICTED: uncharacterized protein LOC104811488 [Tarenaya hassleriana]